MSFQTLLWRVIVINVLRVWYSFIVLAIFAFSYVKNGFMNPWEQTQLKPPSNLSDPKYGVHKYIVANNIKMHYVENGDPSKPLMLFLHGFPEFWYSWRHQLRQLSKNYWCIAVDMRGYGDSEKPKDAASYKFDILVEDVRDLMRQLDREKCILVGHDWGGLIACRFRDQYPNLLHALILLGSCSAEALHNSACRSINQVRKSWYVIFFRMPVLPERLLGLRNMSKAKSILDKDVISKEDRDCYKYLFRDPSAYTPPINYYRVNFVYTLPVKVKCEKKVPFLAALGSKDEYLGLEVLEAMKTEYAYLETTVVDSCGHHIQQEEPEKINNLIREFLDKHGF